PRSSPSWKPVRTQPFVSACDKLHNGRAILGDLRISDQSVWQRFHQGEPNNSGTTALWRMRFSPLCPPSRSALPTNSTGPSWRSSGSAQSYAPDLTDQSLGHVERGHVERGR